MILLNIELSVLSTKEVNCECLKTELNTLIAIDPSYGDLVYTNPELFSDLQIEPQQSITKEEYDKLNDGDKFIFDGVEYTKGE